MNTVMRTRWLTFQKYKRKNFKILHKRLINSRNPTNSGHEAYCIGLVKQRDWEGFISTLLLPKTARRSVFAVRAFNTELSQIGGSVSEIAIGHMRLHFWKECLDSIYSGKPPESPVAIELHNAVKLHNLSKSWLKRMIQARIKAENCDIKQSKYTLMIRVFHGHMLHNFYYSSQEDNIEGQGFRNIRELEDYADNTSTSQLCLTLQCLGIEDLQSDHVASHVGKAQGIITVLRATPYYAVRRKVQLPLEFLTKHLVSQEEIFRGSEEQHIKDLMFDLASQAHIHLQHARDISKDTSKKAKHAFLNVAALDWYLRQLRISDFNVFHPRLQERNQRLPFSVLYRRLSSKL